MIDCMKVAKNALLKISTAMAITFGSVAALKASSTIAQAQTAASAQAGPLKSLTFVEVSPYGEDRYLATYEHSRVKMLVNPLKPDGKISGIEIGELEN